MDYGLLAWLDRHGTKLAILFIVFLFLKAAVLTAWLMYVLSFK
jgi:hypothetical protein